MYCTEDFSAQCHWWLVNRPVICEPILHPFFGWYRALKVSLYFCSLEFFSISIKWRYKWFRYQFGSTYTSRNWMKLIIVVDCTSILFSMFYGDGVKLLWDYDRYMDELSFIGMSNDHVYQLIVLSFYQLITASRLWIFPSSLFHWKSPSQVMWQTLTNEIVWPTFIFPSYESFWVQINGWMEVLCWKCSSNDETLY